MRCHSLWARQMVPLICTKAKRDSGDIWEGRGEEEHEASRLI
jgi:hypothetical protein